MPEAGLLSSPALAAQAARARQQAAVVADAQVDLTPRLSAEQLTAWYGATSGVRGVTLSFAANTVTALIGPSGCGKSTFLRTLNRMHELVPGAHVEGKVLLDGQNIYEPDVSAIAVRRKIGMVFQRPTPFPTMTIRENVAAGLKVGPRLTRAETAEIVERALKRAALWDEVKDRLDGQATALSGGQQQRLCVARTVAPEPEVILLDEPTASLDPIGTSRIEELVHELKREYTVVIVTHNMQQAARVSDVTAFFYLGELIEVGPTAQLFTNPVKAQTEAYVTGRFGLSGRESGIVNRESGTAVAPSPRLPMADSPSPVLSTESYSFWYGAKQALFDVSLKVPTRSVTAFIGPSGCGKSTFLRSINRLQELLSGTRHTGDIRFDGQSIFGRSVDPVELRRRIGMVFQRPNPFPKSIFDNVAYGPRVSGASAEADLPAIVERSLQRAALWEEVKNRLDDPGTSLSGGQQQRLCIARALANQPEVLLMDEPCSALDPIATQRIEELIVELKRDYTIVIVTHNMQQAARVSDDTGFFYLGKLVEFGPTQQIFTNPKDERTEAYITGRFG